MKEQTGKVSLKVHLESGFLPLVLSFAQESASVFGLDKHGSARLQLACEEIFLYLCRAARAGRAVTVEAENGVYYVKIQFLFEPSNFDPYALNFTARVSPDPAGFEDMGMVLAARSVDRFYIVHHLKEGLGLVLIKEKSYAESVLEEIGPDVSLTTFSCIVPDPETLKEFVRDTAHRYDNFSFPAAFRYPGKIVDMTRSGDYHALVAVGTGKKERGTGGGILWRLVGKGMIEFFGPYISDRHSGGRTAVGLVDHFLGTVAKTDAPFVVSRHATAELPEGYFEPLGTILYNLPSGDRPCPFYYRQLKEDPGSQVWTHPSLLPFLKSGYDRLVLPREIHTTLWEGEKRQPHSVFGVQFDREQKSVTLRPVWEGEDAPRNLSDHVRVMTEEGIANVFLEMDLGESWQSLLAPALFDNHFVPVLLLPGAGRSDLVVFQHRQDPQEC